MKKIKNRKNKTIFLIFNFCFLFLIAQPVFAQEFKGIFEDIPCFATGAEYSKCGLCDFLYALLKIAHWGLGGIGVLSLFFFVLSGGVLLTSGGNKNQIEKGKKILTGTLMGIIIIFTAYLIVNYTVSAFTGKWGQFYTKEGLRDWYDVCEIQSNN